MSPLRGWNPNMVSISIIIPPLRGFEKTVKLNQALTSSLHSESHFMLSLPHPFLFVSQRLYGIQLGGLGGGVPAADDSYNDADDKAQEDPQPWYGEGCFHEDGQDVADPYS